MPDRQTVLVVGATGSIGGGAAALAKRGAQVVVLGRKHRFHAIDGLVLSVGLLAQNGPHVLPNGHEVMFATDVLGPLLFTQLLNERMQQTGATVLHVIAPFARTSIGTTSRASSTTTPIPPTTGPRRWTG